jgi:hypothetical protein
MHGATTKMLELFNVKFDANLKLFSRQFTCASVGELKKLIHSGIL